MGEGGGAGMQAAAHVVIHRLESQFFKAMELTDWVLYLGFLAPLCHSIVSGSYDSRSPLESCFSSFLPCLLPGYRFCAEFLQWQFQMTPLGWLQSIEMQSGRTWIEYW